MGWRRGGKMGRMQRTPTRDTGHGTLEDAGTNTGWQCNIRSGHSAPYLVVANYVC